jgi:hypothetical protein
MVYSWGYSWQSVKAADAAAKRAAQLTPEASQMGNFTQQ